MNTANSPLKLICENDFHDLEMEVIQENQNSRPIIKIKGKYIVADERNGNGRRYLTPVMEQAVKLYNEKSILQDRAGGELNHPTSVEVDYNNLCHKILSLKKEGNVWIGESEVITGHPKGDILASLLRHNFKVGMSTRGVGNVTADKDVDQYKLIAIDVVHEPSGPGCFMEGILESKNYMIDQHGDVVELAYSTMEKNIETLSYHGDERSLQIYEAIQCFLKNI